MSSSEVQKQDDEKPPILFAQEGGDVQILEYFHLTEHFPYFEECDHPQNAHFQRISLHEHVCHKNSEVDAVVYELGFDVVETNITEVDKLPAFIVSLRYKV